MYTSARKAGERNLDQYRGVRGGILQFGRSIADSIRSRNDGQASGGLTVFEWRASGVSRLILRGIKTLRPAGGPAERGPYPMLHADGLWNTFANTCQNHPTENPENAAISVRAAGLEPTTYGLKVRCSTN